uniref:glycoside hydrolase family 2 protein n=1 Tax=Promineifilum sp. TaxID=2664178 RepID=UPI0035B2A3DB
DPPRQGVYVTNDRRDPWEGSVRWSLETLDGTALAAGEEAVRAAPLATTAIKTFDLAGHVTDDNRRDLVFIAELWQGAQRVAWQTAYFAPTKHLSLVDPRVAVACRPNGERLQVELRGRSLARLVELSLDGADVIFSDNYFDLPAGRPVTVTCPLPAGWDESRAATALQIRTVYDSFQYR